MQRFLIPLMVFVSAVSFAHRAYAETPQTDVALVKMMHKASASQKLEALALYYDLHVSELTVQSMNEQRTGMMFAKQAVLEAGGGAQKLDAVEQKTQNVMAARAARLDENQALRTKLGTLLGVGLEDPLVMPPDAPGQALTIPQGTPADLAQDLSEAWNALETAKAAWQDERLVLLDAQQRYDDDRSVALGDHMRDMTVAEIAYTKAIGAYRFIAAKIAIAEGQDLAEVLGGL